MIYFFLSLLLYVYVSFHIYNILISKWVWNLVCVQFCFWIVFFLFIGSFVYSSGLVQLSILCDWSVVWGAYRYIQVNLKWFIYLQDQSIVFWYLLWLWLFWFYRWTHFFFVLPFFMHTPILSVCFFSLSILFAYQ